MARKFHTKKSGTIKVSVIFLTCILYLPFIKPIKKHFVN